MPPVTPWARRSRLVIPISGPPHLAVQKEIWPTSPSGFSLSGEGTASLQALGPEIRHAGVIGF